MVWEARSFQTLTTRNDGVTRSPSFFWHACSVSHKIQPQTFLYRKRVVRIKRTHRRPECCSSKLQPQTVYLLEILASLYLVASRSEAKREDRWLVCCSYLDTALEEALLTHTHCITRDFLVLILRLSFRVSCAVSSEDRGSSTKEWGLQSHCRLHLKQQVTQKLFLGIPSTLDD